MNFKIAWAGRSFILGSCLVFLPLALAEESPVATSQAAKQLASWFDIFLKPFEEIGATAERQYLIDRLVDLNRSLFELEQEKRYVIVILKREPLIEDELRRSADLLKAKLIKLRDTIRIICPKLRVAYRKGGDSAVELLSEAIATRNAFVFNLARLNKSGVNDAIKDSQAAVKALSEAQISLADAIAAMQKGEK